MTESAEAAAARLALAPPRVDDAPRPRGVIRQRPADFEVTELGVPAPDGDGAHLWLDLRREDMNTAFAARRLAQLAGVRERDVGYAGLKDRHARTRQWFSLPAPADTEALLAALPAAGLEPLAAVRHGRKLRRGALTGNRFRIRVTLDPAEEAPIDGTAATSPATSPATPPATLFARAVSRVRDDGVPNYFGPQRFGHDGNNLARARDMLIGGTRVRDRHRRGLYLSAARSALFNTVLASRVSAGSWNRLLPGEAVSLDGSASFFHAEGVDAALERRLERFDVHPSGPLWGHGGTPATGEARAVERAALAPHADLMTALEQAGVDTARRALRLPVRDFEVHHETGAVVLAFRLPAGAYATVVLRELFRIEDASARSG